MTAEPQHAKLSASSADRWMNCPGSVRLCAKCPPSPSSKYAEEGTSAHDYAAKILKYEMTFADLKAAKVPGEMIDAIRLYVETVRSLGGVLYTETRVQFSEEAWGTADAVVVRGDELHVLDLKYGAGKVVEAQDNPQVIFYGLATLAGLVDRRKISLLTVWIIQPRAAHESGPVRKMELRPEDWKKWADKFESAVAATKAVDAKLCMGSHCRWCPALVTCPEQGMLTVVDEAQDLRRSITLPEVTQLTTSQIARVLQNLPTLETWASSLRAHAMKLAGEGVQIPDFKLVAGRSYRSWADESAAAKFLVEQIKNAAWEAPKLISPAVAEKENKIKIPEALLARSVPKPSLVPLTDKRPEYKVDPSKMFETIEEGNDNE